MRIAKKKITAVATAVLLSFGVAPAMAKKTGPNLKPGTNLAGPKLNVPQKAPPSVNFGNKGTKVNPRQRTCVRGVFKLAKREALAIKGTMSKAKGIVSHSCAKLKYEVRPALKYAFQAGAFAKAGAKSKKTMATCHSQLKLHAKKKTLYPTLKGKKLIRGMDKACYQAQMDGFSALEAAYKAGIFKSDDRTQKSRFGKSPNKGNKVRPFGKTTKGPKRYTRRQVTKCAKKVKYQIKKGKLASTGSFRKLDAMIRDNCIKLALNAKRTFKSLRPNLKKTGPKLNAGQKRKNRKRSFGLNKKKNSKSTVRPMGKRRPTVKKAITECQQQVWKISSDSLLNPKASKAVIDRKIMESCKLNANVAKRAFPKVRRYFSKSRKIQAIGKSNSGKAAGAFGSIHKGDKKAAAEKCRTGVLGMIYVQKVKNSRKLTPAKMNALANGACKQSKNDAKAAFKIVSMQM
jgi:hypothetical protein